MQNNNILSNQSKPLIFEVGKKFKAGNGSIVEITEIQRDSNETYHVYPIFGMVIHKDMTVAPATYTLEGRFQHGKSSQADLVEEYFGDFDVQETAITQKKFENLEYKLQQLEYLVAQLQAKNNVLQNDLSSLT